MDSADVKLETITTFSSGACWRICCKSASKTTNLPDKVKLVGSLEAGIELLVVGEPLFSCKKGCEQILRSAVSVVNASAILPGTVCFVREW